MIYITDEEDNIRVEGEEVSRHYPYTGILSIPKNSVLMIMDEKSEMVVFKSSANYDTWFTGIIGSIYIEGELVTRETIVDRFNAVAYSAYSSSGGGGGGTMSDECCTLSLQNQEKIISMLSILTNDKYMINEMIDNIINEEIECDNPEIDTINDIIGEEISC
jgi:hypothetical protein